MELEARIKAAYLESGNEMGWRLLTSPSAVLGGAKVAFIGLNPGGTYHPADHAEFCMSEGSAYVKEIWDRRLTAGESTLQRQVRCLFRRLQVEPSKVLAGNLVPFRSPSWSRIYNRQRCLEFGEALWTEILQKAQPELVIGMSRETVVALSRILKTSEPQSQLVGWGKVKGSRAHFNGGVLIGLPHLSRFTIIRREESQRPLQDLFGEYWKT